MSEMAAARRSRKFSRVRRGVSAGGMMGAWVSCHVSCHSRARASSSEVWMGRMFIGVIYQSRPQNARKNAKRKQLGHDGPD